MKKKIISMMAITLIVAFLIPVTGLENNAKENSKINNAPALLIDPIGERV